MAASVPSRNRLPISSAEFVRGACGLEGGSYSQLKRRVGHGSDAKRHGRHSAGFSAIAASAARSSMKAAPTDPVQTCLMMSWLSAN